MADNLGPSFVQTLTPVKTRRRKRASFSPIKTTAAPKTRTQSDTVNPKPAAPEFKDEGLATVSLEFENFTFWDDDGVTMNLPSSAQLRALRRYLNEKYDITELQITPPFLLLWCRRGVPPLEERPFSIAGCIAVWLEKDDPIPADLIIGNFGGMEEDLVVDEDIAADLRAYRLPKPETLRRLSEFFPGCAFVSFLMHLLIIEFEEMEDEAWIQHLDSLPVGIAKAGVAVSYHNGLLVATELKRRKKPQPRYLDGAEDDTDYVKSDGCFYPGALLQADSGDQTSAGIAIQKGTDTRVTVAFHGWNAENEQNPESLGDSNLFKIAQGETNVGYITERISDTDIGLMKINNGIAFNNCFLELDTVAKTLVPMKDLSINEEFVIDSFVTGRQRLRLFGLRTPADDLQNMKGKLGDLPSSGKYLQFSQGIFATGSREISVVPKIRDGVCGAAVVRLTKGPKAGSRENVLEKGQVCGFMHWANIQLKYGCGELLCFADAVDHLIENDWEVCPIAEKRKTDEGDEESPFKRQR